MLEARRRFLLPLSAREARRVGGGICTQVCSSIATTMFHPSCLTRADKRPPSETRSCVQLIKGSSRRPSVTLACCKPTTKEDENPDPAKARGGVIDSGKSRGSRAGLSRRAPSLTSSSLAFLPNSSRSRTRTTSTMGVEYQLPPPLHTNHSLLPQFLPSLVVASSSLCLSASILISLWCWLQGQQEEEHSEAGVLAHGAAQLLLRWAAWSAGCSTAGTAGLLLVRLTREGS